MENDYFSDKISSRFTVITNEQDCRIVTTELGIEPTRSHNKGDIVVGKRTGDIYNRPYGLWEIEMKAIIGEELNILISIEYFQELLGNKIDSVRKLKEYYGFESVFSIDVETEDAGVGFDLYSNEIQFINQIASRFSIHFMSKENIS